MRTISLKPGDERPAGCYAFSIIRPGGNDTALLVGIPDSAARKALTDAIMGIYPRLPSRSRCRRFAQRPPQVEQVGFVNLNPYTPELMMAGGEFCGNATRATAWAVLRGNPGNLEIQVSGVANRLKAGVTESGEAYAQMPVHADASHITFDLKHPPNCTVVMEGITHYIDFNTDRVAGLSDAKIKKKAGADIEARGLWLHNWPAAGIIYTERQTGGVYKITPAVCVRGGSVVVETACGSGTAALGLLLAMENGSSIHDVPIIQPSGRTITVSVKYDGSRIRCAEIKGTVQTLVEGVLEIK